jgi:hypothetical protein
MSVIINAFLKKDKRERAFDIQPTFSNIVIFREDFTFYSVLSDSFKKYNRIIENSVVITLYYVVGVLYYHYREGWSIVDCLYFITVASNHHIIIYIFYYLALLCSLYSDYCWIW